MTRNKKLLISIAAILTVIIAACALVSCSNTVTFEKLIGFNADDVTAIIMINDMNVEKNLTAKKSEIFALFNGQKLSANTKKQHDYEWVMDYGYIINFYVSGYDGYYSLVFNHGTRAMDGYKNKKSKTGFYDFENNSELLNSLHDIFYL